MSNKRKISVSELAKNHCLTVPKMKTVLTNAGILNPATLLPFPEVVAQGLAEIKTVEQSQYSDKPATFAVYQPDIADTLVAAQNEEDRLAFCTSKYQAEKRLNQLIENIGDSYQVYDCDLSEGDMKKHGFADADEAIFQQCKFGDPHFCGGPGWSVFGRSVLDVHVSLFLSETETIRRVAGDNPKTVVYVKAIVRLCEWMRKARK